MTMRSIDLLPALRELPAGEPRDRMSFRDMMAGLVSTDRAAFAAEFSSAVSFSLWAIFNRVNVDDDLRDTMKRRMGGLPRARRACLGAWWGTE